MEAEAGLKLRGDEIESLREHMAGEGFRPEGNNVVAMTDAPCAGSAGAFPAHPRRRRVDAAHVRERIGDLRRADPIDGPRQRAGARRTTARARNATTSSAARSRTSRLRKTLLTAIDELETNIRDRLKATFAVVDQGSSATSSVLRGGRRPLTS